MAKMNIAATTTGVESVVSQFDKLTAAERRVVVEAMKASGAIKDSFKAPNSGPMESLASGFANKIGKLAAAWMSVNKVMGEVNSTMENMQARQDSSMDRFKSYRAAYGSLLLNNPILSTPEGAADKKKIDEFISSRSGKIGGDAPQVELAGAIRDVRSMTGEATTDQQLSAIDAAIQAKNLAPGNVDLAKTAVNLVKAQQKTPGMSPTQAQNVLFATGSLSGGDIANLSQNMIPLYTLVNEQNMRAPIQDVMTAFALGTNKIGDEMGNETVTMVTNLFSRELQSGNVKIGKRKMSFKSENLLDRMMEMLAEIDRQANEEMQKNGVSAGENLRAQLTKQLATQLGGRGAMGVNYLMSLDRARKNVVDPATGETELGMYRRRIGEAKTAKGESYAGLGLKTINETLDTSRFSEGKKSAASVESAALLNKSGQEASFWREEIKRQSEIYGSDWNPVNHIKKYMVSDEVNRGIYNARERRFARQFVLRTSSNISDIEDQLQDASEDPRFKDKSATVQQEENMRRVFSYAMRYGSFSADKRGRISGLQAGMISEVAKFTGIPIPQELYAKDMPPEKVDDAMEAFRRKAVNKLEAGDHNEKTSAPESSAALPMANGSAPAASGQLSMSLDPASIKAIVDGLVTGMSRIIPEQAAANAKATALALNERQSGSSFVVPTFLDQETA